MLTFLLQVYLFSGIRNKTVLEFPSLQSFKKKAKPQTKQLQLPFHWQGTGHVVLDGFLYYHKADTPNQILKVCACTEVTITTNLELWRWNRFVIHVADQVV